MLELKNSKTTDLPSVGGRRRFAIRGFIGAVQMNDPVRGWTDIKPRLIRDTDGWHTEGAPYYAEIKDSGERLFCPDKYEQSKYIRLPSPIYFSGINKDLVANPAKIDLQMLSNQITMQTSWGEYHVVFSNTAMQFEVLFNKAPPASVFSKDSPRILLDIDASGYDITELLKKSRTVGIPRPRIFTPRGEQSDEKFLDWKYANGQLELGFDLTGLSFPVVIKNGTVDVQTGASADDAYEDGAGGYSDSSNRTYLKSNTDDTSSDYSCGGSRFLNITVDKDASIDVAHTELYAHEETQAYMNIDIYGNDVDSALDFDEGEHDVIGRARTTAHTSWVEDYAEEDVWEQSPSIVDVIAEITSRAGWSSGNDLALLYIAKTDSAHLFTARSADFTGSYGAKIYIEWSSGATQQAVGQGAITPAATLGRNISRGAGLGSITPASTLNRKTSRGAGTGAITLTGALNRLTKIVAGSGAVTPVATLGRKVAKVVGSGAITPAATLGRKIARAVGSGVVTPAATLGRKALISVGAGAVTPVGTLARKVYKAVGSGVITPVGELGAQLAGLIQQAVGQGSVAIAGALNRKISIPVGEGAVAIAGVLSSLKTVIFHGLVERVRRVGRRHNLGILQRFYSLGKIKRRHRLGD